MSDFEWDPEKEVFNIQKHGIDFTTAKLIWSGPVFERLDDRHDYGEERFQAFGVAENRILTVIFTWRGATRRIISARRSSLCEKRLYQTTIPKLGRSSPD
jgi:uncharacterized DUF497 family protein